MLSISKQKDGGAKNSPFNKKMFGRKNKKACLDNNPSTSGGCAR